MASVRRAVASTACGRLPRSFQAETCMHSISAASLIHTVGEKKNTIVWWEMLKRTVAQAFERISGPVYSGAG